MPEKCGRTGWYLECGQTSKNAFQKLPTYAAFAITNEMLSLQAAFAA
jgi:hypothetical protein